MLTAWWTGPEREVGASDTLRRELRVENLGME
jgi:hypothetical protein